VVKHSNQASKQHAIDVKAQEENPLLGRLGAQELRAAASTASHPCVAKGELLHDESRQGFIPGVGICSTTEAEDFTEARKAEFRGLKVKTGSLKTHRAAISEAGGVRRNLNEEDVVRKETFTFHPGVSTWFKDATPRERDEFLSEVIPKISDWSDEKFAGADPVCLQVHADTAHLHVDCWMSTGKILDFGGRTHKAILYDPKALDHGGAGVGICHLVRKKTAYDLARLEISKSDTFKLEAGLAKGQKRGRLKDVEFQKKFDRICRDAIGGRAYDECSIAYATGDRDQSPLHILDQFEDMKSELKIMRPEFEAIKAKEVELKSKVLDLEASAAKSIKNNEILIHANNQLRAAAVAAAAEVKTKADKATKKNEILTNKNKALIKLKKTLEFGNEINREALESQLAKNSRLEEKILQQNTRYKENELEITAREEKSMDLEEAIMLKKAELARVDNDLENRQLETLKGKSLLESADPETANKLLIDNLSNPEWCAKFNLTPERAAKLAAKLSPKPKELPGDGGLEM